MENNKEKIFVSYAQKDIIWAEWMAEELEKKGFSVIIQSWDFNPGDNFVRKMDEVLRTSSIVVAVLSEAYLKSYHCQTELTAGYAKKNLKLIPVRVDDFEVEGLWASINYIDLVGKTEEEARNLLEGISKTPERKSKGFPEKASDTQEINTTDFFISYVKSDKNWAVWIAGTLIMSGYSAKIQDWDFTQGENFISTIENILKSKKRLIVVMSKASMKSAYCQAEWTTAFKIYSYRDDTLFIPVRIEDVKIEGLLTAVRYIDLVGKNEEEAEITLLDAIEQRPGYRPNFPRKSHSDFPGRSIFNNLPERNNKFTGRGKLLENIHKTFKQKEVYFMTQAIVGIGGIGKTEVVKEYAYRHLREYDCIWWVNAETDKTILTSYRNFASRKNLINEDTKEDEVIINAVRNWMQYHDNWLFIFDNAADEKSLLPFLPPQINWRQHILITSRNKNFLRFYTNINIFTESEACEFIKKLTGKTADSHLKELAKKMGYLPLALDQAGAYMNIYKMSYESYLSLYNSYHVALLAEYDDDPEKKTVATTWQISFEKIKKNLSAEILLNLCAFFAPDNIYTGWFQLVSSALPDELQALRDVVVNDLKYKEAIADLTRYSLVSQKGEGVIGIHRLMQEVIRHNLKQEQPKWRSFCVSILNELLFFDFSTAESRALFLALAPHIDSVTQEIVDDEATEKVATLYFFMGRGFYELADYPQALEYNLKALSIREKVLGDAHPDTALSYNNIGEVYRKQGNYDLALKYYMKALSICEKVLGNAHPDTAISYNNIGAVYDSQGNYDLALEYYMKALSIYEKVLGDAHPDTARSYNDIGAVYYSLGNYDLALEFYMKALSIREKVLGDAHPDTAQSYNKIGAVYYSQGNYNLALKYFEKALVICEKVLGKDHPLTAKIYNNIGAVHNKKGNYFLTLEYYLKALTIREKVLGEEHPDTATSYNNIGFVHCELGNYNLALEYFMKDLAICEKVLGMEHPDTATSYNNIGFVHSKKGNYDLALEYCMKGIVICEKVLNEKHPDTAASYNIIGLVFYKKGNYDLALVYYNKALAIREKVLGIEHPDKANSFYNIGSVYLEQGNYDLALEYYNKALAIREKVLGTEHPATANSYNNIGTVYLEQGNYDLALEYYNKALAIREKFLGAEHPSTANSYNNIGSVYLEQGNYDLALEYYGKALTIREKVLGNEHPDTVKTNKNIASVYEAQGDYDKAKEFCVKASVIDEEALEFEKINKKIKEAEIHLKQDDNEKALESYAKVLDVVKTKCDYYKAVDISFEMLAIQEKKKNNPAIAIICKDIGGFQFELGKHKEALKYFCKSLDAGSFDQHETAFIYRKIAECYYYMGENVKTIEYNDKALSIDETFDNDFNLTAEISKRIRGKYEKDGYKDEKYNSIYNKNPDLQVFIKIFFDSIKMIRNGLTYKGSDDVCHYTKRNTLKYLIRYDKSEPKYRLSNIKYMNDPFEGGVFINLIELLANTPGLMDDFFKPSSNNDEKLSEIFNSDIYVGSFTTAKNNLPMWTLYGDNAKGCCLIFKDEFFKTSEGFSLFEVEYIEYKDNKPCLGDGWIKKALETIAFTIKKWKDEIIKDYDLRFWVTEQLETIRFLFKADDYKYEKEIRLIIRSKGKDIKIDDMNAIPKLYIEADGRLGFTEIILGSKIENLEEVAAFILHCSKGTKVMRSGIKYQ